MSKNVGLYYGVNFEDFELRGDVISANQETTKK